MKKAIKRLSRITIIRWILLFALIMIVAYVDMQNSTLLFMDFLLSELSDITNICYYYLFLLLIIIADCYNGTNAISHRILALSTALETLVFIICILFGYTIIGALNRVLFYPLFTISGVVPILKSVLLLYCRFYFFALIILIINTKAKSQCGFIAPIAISIFETYFYDIFKIDHSLYMLPLENSRIYYTQTYLRFDGPPPLFSLQCVYWAILLGLTIAIFLFVIRGKKHDHFKN